MAFMTVQHFNIITMISNSREQYVDYRYDKYTGWYNQNLRKTFCGIGRYKIFKILGQSDRDVLLLGYYSVCRYKELN